MYLRIYLHLNLRFTLFVDMKNSRLILLFSWKIGKRQMSVKHFHQITKILVCIHGPVYVAGTLIFIWVTGKENIRRFSVFPPPVYHSRMLLLAGKGRIYLYGREGLGNRWCIVYTSILYLAPLHCSYRSVDTS